MPVLVNSWKENFSECLQPNAWAKIKVSVDAAGPTKSIRHCKDKIKNLKDTSKQAKDNNETSR